MTKKIFIIILVESTLIVLLACGIFFVARHYKKNANEENSRISKTGKVDYLHYKGKSNITTNTIPSVPVEVTKVIRKNMNIFLVANCNIEAEKEIDILSKTSGEVKQILVEEGESVISGNLLAQLDEKEASLALKEAKVKLENTNLLYDRSQKTFSDKIMSKEEFEEYKLNYQMAQVEYEKRKLELDYYKIRSPIQGTIVERFIEVGDNVQEGQTLFKLAKFDRIYGKVYIPEKDLKKIKQGQTAYISVESIPNLRFEGRVKLINPVIDSRSGTIKVTVEIMDEKITLLRPGMFATVFIMIDEHQNAIVIPKKALVMDSIIDEVFVIKNLAKTFLPKDVGERIFPGRDVNIYIKSLVGEQRDTGVSQKPFLGKIIDVKDRTTLANSLESPLDFQAVIELNDLLPFNLDESIVDINILNDDDTTYLQLSDTVLKVDTIAYKTKIDLGFSEGTSVEALSGLTENDVVIVAGHEDLIQGSRVSIVND